MINVDLSAENAAQTKPKVSSNAFFHRFAAPTFPPVKCKAVYNRDAASSKFLLVEVGALPFKNRSERTDKAACEGLCRLGYRGTSRASVVNMRT